MYKVGTRLIIKDAGCGALGANGCKAIVIPYERATRSGVLSNTPHFNVILEDGNTWSVSSFGEYEVIDSFKKPFNKGKKKVKKSNIPEKITVSNVIHYNPITIVIWSDGTVTKAKCQDGDIFDEEKGFLVCVGKKFFGSNNSLNKHLSKYCN